ncbi:GTPase IMAP family member 8-like isoform X4 [Brachyhypopomus gauderio]|uniref:GTPase IMAP family member 8-like isoform X4 n=1 Tax=Brachyhypopomus gauderio TaxID=698409 RepID=UPI0040432025
MGDSHHLSDLRTVLLGYRDAGKSSAGNTILGREEFELKTTAQCVKRQGEVAGRKITVVEAPGWWKNEHIEDISRILKWEIVLSVCLCFLVPHCLLLVMLLVLNHIKQYIESEESAFQWMVEKCGNNHHVLNNNEINNNYGIKDLLRKLRLMMKNKNLKHKMHRRKWQQLEMKEHFKSEEGNGQGFDDVPHSTTDKVKSQKQNMRIVLLGNKNAGKSSAGNTILGREKFELKRTVQCVKRQGEVAGRKITVVEAPGWWMNDTVEESSKILKQEIVLSVSPGPHVLLLVLRVGTTFEVHERRVVEGHMQLLTERVWSHTIVLFTHGDGLTDTPIEQHIESEGSTLQWLVEKCGNRYHVLNNKNRGDDTQVTELLEKIEEMVAANNGCHFQIKTNITWTVKESRSVSKKRANSRMMKVQKQREYIRSKMGDTHHLSDLRIVLLGYRCAGKSSAGNTILGREKFELKRTAQCVKRQGEVAGSKITVVEAPGWSINAPVEQTSEILKQEIVLSVSLCPPGPHVLLLVLRVDTTFKEQQSRVLEGHMKLLTERVWSHTIVLFTHGDYLGETPIEQYIETEDISLRWLVEKCGNRYHVLNNMNRGDDTQVTELLEKIEEMVAANSGSHFEMDRKILQEVEEKKKQREYIQLSVREKSRSESTLAPMKHAHSRDLPPDLREKSSSESTLAPMKHAHSRDLPPDLREKSSSESTLAPMKHAHSRDLPPDLREKSRSESTLAPMKHAHSRDLPPDLSKEDGFDAFSARSSGYGSQKSMMSSMMSLSSCESGSVESIAESTSSGSRKKKPLLRTNLTTVPESGESLPYKKNRQT